jgi:succinate dehydrogenase/fumarate reductase flavoprotein subunit
MEPKDPKAEVNVTRRDFVKTTVGSVGATAMVGLAAEEAEAAVPKWDRVADVVIVGAGAAGLPAAIRARDLGASVIIVEVNTDIGGHAMLSGGQVWLGGGTSLQKKFGIVDSADEVYLEQTRPDHPTTRYADRKVVRAFANINAEAFEFLITNGVEFLPGKPVNKVEDGSVALRLQSTKPWSDDYNETINGSGGSGLVRALEKSARAKGVEILLQHKMTRIVREQPQSGRVLGIATTNLKDNTTVTIRARKGVIGCTGGSSSNVVIRTIYDPRLTEEYNAGGEPWTLQSGDTEQLGMAIGASLGATSNDRTEALVHLIKANWIGCRDGYVRWSPKSPRFAQAGASGIAVLDYQDVILVNMMGQRFHNEIVARNRAAADSGRATFDYIADALASAVVDGPNGKERRGGPVWTIFDADAAKREKWDLRPPNVDIARGYFFSADTPAELAEKISKNGHQKVPMSPATLQDTVARYNSFVDAGKDDDFGKPSPKYKIQTPPFYAAWATPILHDSLTGLRINEKCQVLDIYGKVIPGFYCAGEAAGAFALHGLGRCIGTGYIAATNAAAEDVVAAKTRSL